MTDPASLQNLHDIIVPPAVQWWPPAPGWFVVMAAVMVVGLLLGHRGWKWWRRNRYRGQALRELAQIRQSNSGADLRRLPVLLKRAALSAWRRETVAGMVGPDWYRFLDETGQTDCFGSGIGRILDKLAYAPATGAGLSAAEAGAALDAVERWLRRHRAPAENR